MGTVIRLKIFSGAHLYRVFRKSWIIFSSEKPKLRPSCHRGIISAFASPDILVCTFCPVPPASSRAQPRSLALLRPFLQSLSNTAFGSSALGRLGHRPLPFLRFLREVLFGSELPAVCAIQAPASRYLECRPLPKTPVWPLHWLPISGSDFIQTQPAGWRGVW